MTETYYPIGPTLGYATAIVGLFGLAIAFAVGWSKRRKPILTKLDIGRAVLYVLGAIIFIPISILLFLEMAVQAVRILRSKDVRSIGGRIAYAVPALAMGSFIVLMLADNRITLGPDVITSNRTSPIMGEEPRTVARQGLEVHGTGGHPWWMGPDWHSWTTFNSSQLGPHWAGYTLFWGPHGFILGDGLGKRVGEWANTVPQVHDRGD